LWREEKSFATKTTKIIAKPLRIRKETEHGYSIF